MTQYKWVINQMDCVPKEGTLLDVVNCVHWSRTAEQYVSGEPILVSINGTMHCESPSETDFTSYPDLTYEQVCIWLEAVLNVAELDSNLDSQIENIINPPIVNLPLPWVR